MQNSKKIKKKTIEFWILHSATQHIRNDNNLTVDNGVSGCFIWKSKENSSFALLAKTVGHHLHTDERIVEICTYMFIQIYSYVLVTASSYISHQFTATCMLHLWDCKNFSSSFVNSQMNFFTFYSIYSIVLFMQFCLSSKRFGWKPRNCVYTHMYVHIFKIILYFSFFKKEKLLNIC